MKKILYCIPIVLLLITGCNHPYINAQTFYSSRKDLASTAIDTPDPEKSTKQLSQIIWVQWREPQNDQKLFLHARIRFEDRSEILQKHQIFGKSGEVTLAIPPEDFMKRGRIQSYKITIENDSGTILNECNHKMWVEPIIITQ